MVGWRNSLRQRRPSAERRDQHGKHNTVVECQQRVGDPPGRGKLSRAVHFDEVPQGDNQFAHHQGEKHNGRHAMRLGPAQRGRRIRRLPTVRK